jgi:hypothetical protein
MSIFPLLELILGSGLLVWGLRGLPEMLERLDRAPLETVRVPPADFPPLPLTWRTALLLALLLWMLWRVLPVDVFWSLVPGALLLIGATLVITCRTRRLGPRHPWRIEVESLALRVGVSVKDVQLVYSTNTAISNHDGTIQLPSLVLRAFSQQERAFLIALSLCPEPGFDNPLESGWPQDRFALALTGSLDAAVSAIRHEAAIRPHFYADTRPDVVQERIDGLERWWLARQSATPLAPILVRGFRRSP